MAKCGVDLWESSDPGSAEICSGIAAKSSGLRAPGAGIWTMGRACKVTRPVVQKADALRGGTAGGNPGFERFLDEIAGRRLKTGIFGRLARLLQIISEQITFV